MQEKKRSSETLPAEGIGYIPVTRGHREGFGDCAMCHRVYTRDEVAWRKEERTE